MNEANKVKLGAFLLISITLLITAFLAAGISQIFSPKFHAVTILNTSVEGLAVGSPVKYLGMPIGKITRMAMRENDGCVAVYFDIFPAAVETEDSDDDTGTVADIANIMHRKNLMCFINAAGIMGGTYLELSINESSQPALPHLEFKPQPGVSYIPSRPSHIGNAIQNISRMLDELEKVNFIQLADKLNQTLDNMNDILNQSELRSTLKSVNNICSTLENTVQRLQTVLSDANVEKLNRSIDNIDISVQNLKRTVSSDELSATVKNLNSFLTDARRVLNGAESSGKQLGAEAGQLKLRLEMSLTRLDNALKEFADLARNISADPGQFVRGRQEKPVQPAK